MGMALAVNSAISREDLMIRIAPDQWDALRLSAGRQVCFLAFMLFAWGLHRQSWRLDSCGGVM
jgi:hypothetical protein